MYTVQLKLETAGFQDIEINKRFHVLSHVHNVMVKHAQKLLSRLSMDRDYLDARKTYGEAMEKIKSVKTWIGRMEQAEPGDRDTKALRGKQKELKRLESQKKETAAAMNSIRRNLGLTESGFQSYLKVCGKRYRNLLSSQQVQKEASRVWQSVEKYLFGNGKSVHFKKFMDFNTVSGKTNKNGLRYWRETNSVTWNGLSIPCRIPDNTQEIMLCNDIAYCELKRMMFNNGWHYYIILYMKGDLPSRHKVCNDDTVTTGIDIGVSSIAAAGDNGLLLRELFPEHGKYDKEIRKLQAKMDRSKRLSNPDNYDPDGTIKKGRKKWVFSKTYLKDRRKLKTLYRKRSACRKQQYEILANGLLEASRNFVVERMSFAALAKKAKKTKRKDTPSKDVLDSKGNPVYKYKRKKRHGKSIGTRAPVSLISIIRRKAVQAGGNLLEVDTRKFRASQYDHVTGEYKKRPLSERIKTVGGYEVQRDLYSAFLLKNSNIELTAPDRGKCITEFEWFVREQDRLIREMKENGISMKQCFGF